MYTLKIEDFDYEIKENNLTFKKLLNNEEKDVKLLDKYNIDGKDYIVNEIEEDAFSRINIYNIELPDTIETIRYNAFFGTNIERFVCPPKVTEIPDSCFSNCNKLKNVVLHDDIKYIGHNAFSETKIEKIIIPKKTTEIKDWCFADCKNLTDVVLHDDIEKIGKSAFMYSFIKKFIVPPKVTVISNSCFYNCENLTDVVLHDDIEEFGNYAFLGTAIEKFICPPKVTEIPNGCFTNCRKLKNLDLNNVKIIEFCAFDGCIKLNISYQNDKYIYINDYDELKNKGFIDAQINQIFKGYENQIYLNSLPIDTPNFIFEIFIEKFNKKPKIISNIIKQMEEHDIVLNNYKQLIDAGFVNDQINQILKGYEKLIFLNNLPVSTPVEVFRTIINNFYKDPKSFTKIINDLSSIDEEHNCLDKKIKLYNKIDELSQIRVISITVPYTLTK